MLSFLTENASKDFQETASIGGFNRAVEMNSFDDIFKEAYDSLLGGGTDVMVDINKMLKNKAVREVYKDKLLGELKTECELMSDPDKDYGTQQTLYEQVSQMFDNCIEDFVKESTSVGQLLPIKAIDLPILIKQYLQLATKEIMQTEVVNSPVVKKHIEQTYVYSRQDPNKRWKYPQCFFSKDFREIYAEGKGLPIKNDPVTLPIFNFDVPKELTDLTADEAKSAEYTMALEITKAIVDADGEDVEYIFDPAMRINLSDNTWLGGKIDATVKKSDGTEVQIQDIVTGMADMRTHTVSVNCINGQVKSVVFSGHLSNERNERRVSFDYQREEVEWKIEDGSRADASYSIEELEDAKALMDIDLYRKTYSNLTEYLTQMEDSNILDWLDEQFEKYDGIELTQDQLLGWSAFITKRTFDCDSTGITTALPDEYISRMLKFAIDGLLIDIADNCKLDDFTFVLYGNPRFIRFLSPEVDWVRRPGDRANGVKLDYAYGVMTSGDTKVQVVSTKKVIADYDNEEKAYSGLRLIPFPLNKEQFTFKHYKWTTHVLTDQNSAYRDKDLPGGAKNYLMGVSRYLTVQIQGIQAQMKIANAEQYVRLPQQDTFLKK